MTFAIGCLLIGIGLYLTLFTERFVARAVRHTRSHTRSDCGFCDACLIDVGLVDDACLVAVRIR